MRTVTINGSVRFALLTVRLKNGTVTVKNGTVTVKNGTEKKTENGTDTVRCQIRTPYCITITFYANNNITNVICLLKNSNNFINLKPGAKPPKNKNWSKKNNSLIFIM